MRTGRVSTTRAAARLDETRFQGDDILLFGSEGAGVPDHVHARADLRVRIPIRAEVRSLNLSVSAGIALAEALRQAGGWPR
jgi:tRNA (cytidine/uridine-2'-O-)-methyltransferase